MRWSSAAKRTRAPFTKGRRSSAAKSSAALAAGYEVLTSYIRRGAGDVAEDCHVGGGEMYRLMVDEFAAVVAGVKPALHPLASTIAVARTVDRLRAAAGIAPAL